MRISALFNERLFSLMAGCALLLSSSCASVSLKRDPDEYENNKNFEVYRSFQEGNQLITILRSRQDRTYGGSSGEFALLIYKIDNDNDAELLDWEEGYFNTESHSYINLKQGFLVKARDYILWVPSGTQKIHRLRHHGSIYSVKMDSNGEFQLISQPGDRVAEVLASNERGDTRTPGFKNVVSTDIFHSIEDLKKTDTSDLDIRVKQILFKD